MEFDEQDMSPVNKYWRELSDLTIEEAAFWTEIGGDLLEHQIRCNQDHAYESCYSDHPGGEEAVEKKCGVIKSAVRAGLIKTTESLDSNGKDLNNRTHILKDDWLNWCRRNNYSELANRFGHGKELESGTGEHVPEKTEPHSTDAATDVSSSSGNQVSTNWMDQARKIADDCFDNDTKGNCRDSLKGYSRRVMDKMQALGIRGPRGIMDNPNTVMREALQGKKWWQNKFK